MCLILRYQNVSYCLSALHLRAAAERLCTRVGVPFIVVMRAFLLADELLVHDLFELDHCGGCEISFLWNKLEVESYV